MSDALTTAEVKRLTRDAIRALHAIETPKDKAAKWRYQLDRVEAHLNELQFLCELVECADAGIVVVVDR